MTRWINGWAIAGALITPMASYAMNGGSPLLFLVGGTGAVSFGAWLSAKLRGRTPGQEAIVAGSAFLIAACVYVAAGAGEDFNTVSSETTPYGHYSNEGRQFLPFLYAIACLAVFGGLYGFGAGTLYKRDRLVLAVDSAGAALLAGFLMFYACLFLAGYHVFGFPVRVALVLGGFLGALFPGRMIEKMLRSRDGA